MILRVSGDRHNRRSRSARLCSFRKVSNRGYSIDSNTWKLLPCYVDHTLERGTDRRQLQTGDPDDTQHQAVLDRTKKVWGTMDDYIRLDRDEDRGPPRNDPSRTIHTYRNKMGQHRSRSYRRSLQEKVNKGGGRVWVDTGSTLRRDGTVQWQDRS
ncbi:hypothetical protein LZ30DRAFT_302321 [Colletotrichum cereale]|nr:hypothetical protein LZ30DRAFT_302321 [Colletotrichum cereale]